MMLSKTYQKPKIILGISLALIVSGLFASPALADGIVIPDPPPFSEPITLEETWLTILYHRVSVEIDHQVAVTRVEQEFLNENDWEVEGTYIFPIPEGAVISDFIMWVNGEPQEGKVLPADEAKDIYESIVRERRDPALLEYIGQEAVQARIYPIPAGGTRKIELEYSEILQADNGLVKYLYPLNTEKFSARPLEDCSVRIELKTDQALHSVYSPTHQDRIYISREGDYKVLIGYEERDILPDQDFELIYSYSKEDIGLNLLVYPDSRIFDGSSREGYFMLMAAPKVSLDYVVPRDVILVLDTSGSMDGEKIEQAKEASKYVLKHLNDEDRFNVIAFSTGLKRYALDLQPASRAQEALSWIGRMDALGGTNINLALLDALSMRDVNRSEMGRPLVIIFLTDGLPTEGVTEIDQIVANVGNTGTKDLRLFVFGVGDDVNTILLDLLASENRGLTSYVRPEERIDEEVSALYAKIKTPVLTDIELDFGEVQVEEIYPPNPPDLFSGTQLTLTGRYRLPDAEAGRTTVILSGYVNNRFKDFSYRVDFNPDRDQQRNHFIPRLWAARKIGYLLSQIRLHGENSEWVDAIIQLSIRYGIITPYTSFLVEEHDIMAGEGVEEKAKDLVLEFAAPAVGAEAVDQADAESNLRSAESFYQPTMPQSESGEFYDMPEIQYVEDKTFLKQNGVWIDTVYDPGTMDTKKIQFGSGVYFELLGTRPSWGRFMALGDHVIFVVEGTAYEVGDAPGDFDTLPPGLEEPEEESPSLLERDLPKSTSPRSICPGTLLTGLFLVGLVSLKMR
jgi:Ca-activated chloride channel family protein